jgi:aspartyl/asparaginyl-tRNA synthetase
MMHPNTPYIEPTAYHKTISRLREFFLGKGFVETSTQSRLSILAACEDPTTIATYEYAGEIWPLPQTGQMWLEHELLKSPETPGFFCISTSYRQEPNPVPGRHEIIFPMFEFETKGGMKELEELERELLVHLGFGEKTTDFAEGDYLKVAQEYGVKDICGETEGKICKDKGNAFLLKNFPQYTSPFWNMKKNGDKAEKIDVLLYGMETIGSAERSCNPDEMRELFYTISGGEYAGILFRKFGRERVEKELEEFLSYNFFQRFGGGIGVTRMARALELLERETIGVNTEKPALVAA